MDSNSAVSSSKEHGIDTVDNEGEEEKKKERGGGGRREAGLGSLGLPIRRGGGGGRGRRGVGVGVGGLHSCFHIPGQVQEGSRVH